MTELKENAKPTPALISFISGLSAGIADTACNYPPYGLHYRVGRGINIWNLKYWKFRELYRGVGAYASIIPVTCVMDGLSDYLQKTGVHPALAPFMSGVIAAMFIGTPVGNLIVTDQRLSEANRLAGFRNSFLDIKTNRGYIGFTTGIQWIMMREGVYSWSVFYAKNATKEYLSCNDLIASIISGTLATIISQPMDTSATYMQNQSTRPRLIECAKRMYREDGLRRFYRGVGYRWYAVIAGIYIMDKVSQNTKSILSGFQ